LKDSDEIDITPKEATNKESPAEKS
jgi:hypothetical protein